MDRSIAHNGLMIDLILEFSLAKGVNYLLGPLGKIEVGGILQMLGKNRSPKTGGSIPVKGIAICAEDL